MVICGLLLGTAFAAVVVEITLRLYVATRGWTPNGYVTGLVFFVPHPTAGYSLRPGLRLKSSSSEVRVNSLGLRGPEVEREKTEGMARIAVLGGSSVFGYWVRDGEDSCRQLERQLQAEG